MHTKDSFQQLMIIEPCLNREGVMKCNVKINDVIFENLIHNPIFHDLKKEKLLQIVEGLLLLFEIENKEFLKIYKMRNASNTVKVSKRKEAAQ